MERMQVEVEEMVDFLRRQFDLDVDFFHGRFKEALVRVPPSHLVRVKGRGGGRRPETGDARPKEL